MRKFPISSRVKILLHDDNEEKVIVSGSVAEYGEDDSDILGILLSEKEAEKLKPIGHYYEAWEVQEGIVWFHEYKVKKACRLNRKR